jgi:hypothetical protein
VVSHFYGTEYEIRAGFMLVGITENFGLGRKVCYTPFEGNIFLLFYFLNIVASALKTCITFKYKFQIG